MKKSKIIVPALAVLLLSTAASVTGTVAWFTANRVFNATVGEFAVVNTKDNLVCEMGAGLGTNVVENVVSVDTGKVLTDASFDHITSSHYIFAPNAEGDAVGKKVALADADMTTGANGLKREENAEVYSAFTFTMNFKLRVSTSGQDTGLFFRANEAVMAKKVTLPVGFAMGTGIFFSDAKCQTPIEAGFVTGTPKTAYTKSTALSYQFQIPENTAIPAETYYTTAACDVYVEERGASGEAVNVFVKNPYRVDTGLGFRLAFIGTTATYTETRVWSDFRPATGDHHAKHVDGAAAVDAEFATVGTTLDYVAPALIDSTNAINPDLLSGDRDDYVESPSFLGYFDKDEVGETVSLQYTVVAWFEGTDDNIKNTFDTIYDTMVSYLSFGTVRLPNA